MTTDDGPNTVLIGRPLVRSAKKCCNILCKHFFIILAFVVSNKINHNIQGAPKSKPLGKFDISGTVLMFFAKFTTLTEKDSGHIIL